MSGDILALLAQERRLIKEEKLRLGLLRDTKLQNDDVRSAPPDGERPRRSRSGAADDKENVSPLDPDARDGTEVATASSSSKLEDNHEIRARNNNNNPALELFRSDAIREGKAMLRYGEYSPNNPQVRVTAAPYIGLGEYEQRRNFFLQKQRADYLEHLSKKNDELKRVSESVAKYAQTDIQNIHCPLVVQHELESYSNSVISGGVPGGGGEMYGNGKFDRELTSPRYGRNNRAAFGSSGVPMQNRHFVPSSSSAPAGCSTSASTSPSSYRLDQRLTSAQNALLMMDSKPKSILSNRRTGSPRERLLSDLKHSYTPSFLDGFGHPDRADELELERLKRDAYQHELRAQIDEKRHLQALRDDQERRERDLDGRRLDAQLARMQDERAADERRRDRRHSDDLRRHHHRPSRRDAPDPRPQNRFSRYDSLGRIDALEGRMESLSIQDGCPGSYDSYGSHGSYGSYGAYGSGTGSLGCAQRRHSATQQDLSVFRNGRSPKAQRRGSSGRFDDSLPIPVLRVAARSPVAKDLKNSVPFDSSRHNSSSDAVRRLEDKWQIPAVQKNIVVNHSDPLRDGRSILTQLGAIRMQLQQEQLRMDETLRKRGLTQSKAVDFH